MKAMILAAGEGTRLKPLTVDTPKVLLPVGGVPIIEYTLLWLKSHAVTEVAINLNYLGSKITDFLGDGSRLGIRITYSHEPTLLGTAGGIKKVEHFFDSTFAVIYGDIFTDFSLSAMLDYHRKKKAIATLALLRVLRPWEVGVVEINEEGRILSFVEKPPRGQEVGNLASGGIYILEKEILNYIPSEGFCDFAYDIFPRITKLGLRIYGYCLSHEDYLMDIGTKEKYLQINEDVRVGKVKLTCG